MKPLAITLGDPAGIGAEVVFKALHTMSVPVRLFGSRAFAKPPGEIEFVDVGGSGALSYGKVSAEYGRISLDSIDVDNDAQRRRDETGVDERLCRRE